MSKKASSGVSQKEMISKARALCDKMLKDLEEAKRPVLECIKCSLDNSEYDSRLGYLTPIGKMVRSELNVSSVQKLARTVFMLKNFT